MQPLLEEMEADVPPEIQLENHKHHNKVLSELMCSEVTSCEDEEEEDEGTGEDESNSPNNSSILAYFDTAVLHHPEILGRLKLLEGVREQPRGYFGGESDILPYMRKVVGSWMLEVCEEQNCDEAVFPLAISLLDQFLSDCFISKEQLQLAACVCLLLASKTRQCNHFSLDLLSWYTDNSVDPQALRTWELAMLSHFNWDVSLVTAIDFVDVFLVRSGSSMKHASVIRRHATTFIALCATEPRFVGLPPSLIAASALYAAARGLRSEVEGDLLLILSRIASRTPSELQSIAVSIEQVIAKEIKVMEEHQNVSSGGGGGPKATSTPIRRTSSSSSSSSFSCAQISEEILV